MIKLSGLKRFGLALGLALALTAQSSYAGSIFIDLTISDGTDTSNFLISNGSGFEAPGTTDNNIITDTGFLNTLLAGNGLGQVTLTNIGAQSNNAGSTLNAILSQNGALTLAAGSGNITLTALVYQTDFTLPVGFGTLQSTTNSTFTNTGAGDNSTFQSWFDPSNTGAMTVPSPLLSLIYPNLANSTDSDSDTAAPTALGLIGAPYALVNEINLSITAAAGQTVTVSYGGSTVVTATAIPEPASVVMMMSAFPIAFGLLRRHRRGTK